ncbi:MAG: ornithine cyclodeaminase family protein [Candidatus Dormibacteria bacterium]
MTPAWGELLLLNRNDVAAVLRASDLLQPLARALVGYSQGRADSPPRAGARAPGGWLGAMPGYLAEDGLAAKLVTVFPENSTRDQPSHQGVVALFDAEDGRPLCVLDAGQITAVRTAAVTALSVRELARPDAGVLAVLGSGEQARSHLELLPSVGQFQEVRLAARRPERAAAVAALRPGTRASGSFEEAVRGADVVICCTNAQEPVVQSRWLGRGVHLVSVGMGPELGHSTLAGCHLFVEWRGAVASPPPAGAVELQGLDPASATELGEVLAGSAPGRLSTSELTVFKSTGLAVEDVAAARVVFEAALRQGVGIGVRW